jgi:hypothetical protein
MFVQREISKFNPIFVSLTRDDPKFASLLKVNLEARELFNSEVFASFTKFQDFLSSFPSPNDVNGHLYP